MRKKILRVLVVMVGLALAGCDTLGGARTNMQQTIPPVLTGQTYVPSLGLVRDAATARARVTTLRKVAIFPFADYSHQQSFIQPLVWGGNRSITEAIADRFIAKGIAVALQEDVEGLLMAQGLIRLVPGEYTDAQDALMEQIRRRASVVHTPEFEWIWGLRDQAMLEELEKVVSNQEYFRNGGLRLTSLGELPIQGVTTALSRAQLIELGRLLDVDLIIRGRILEFGLQASSVMTSVVQIRIYAQDARTGELVWSNHGEVEVEERRPFGLRAAHAKPLLDRATREVTNALMADFFGDR